MELQILKYDGSLETILTDFRILPVGVVINVGRNSEVLIPWHRVHQIMSHERGSINI